jgi:hypothetical protein
MGAPGLDFETGETTKPCGHSTRYLTGSGAAGNLQAGARALRQTRGAGRGVRDTENEDALRLRPEHRQARSIPPHKDNAPLGFVSSLRAMADACQPGLQKITPSWGTMEEPQISPVPDPVEDGNPLSEMAPLKKMPVSLFSQTALNVIYNLDRKMAKIGRSILRENL